MSIFRFVYKRGANISSIFGLTPGHKCGEYIHVYSVFDEELDTLYLDSKIYTEFKVTEIQVLFIGDVVFYHWINIK